MTLSDSIARNRIASVSTAWALRRNQWLQSITWAVWLGANTANRLGAEWGISKDRANYWLRKALEMGLLRVTKGRNPNVPHRYRISRMEAGMNDRSTGRTTNVPL